MWLRDIFTKLVELCTGLPSKATFIKKHVVPAKPGDKFYNDRCGICWGDYDAEHPRAKISCGHIFCLDCIRGMVKSPTGELCPYCQKKLFGPDLAELVGNLLVQALDIYVSALEIYVSALAIYVSALAIYVDAVIQMMSNYNRIKPYLETQVPWLVYLFFGFLNDGPAGIVLIFVDKFTYLVTRNSVQALKLIFSVGLFLPSLIQHGAIFAPILLPVYLIFGLYPSLWTFFVLDLGFNSDGLRMVRLMFLPLIEQADRKLVGLLADTAFMARELMVFFTLFPGTFPVALRFVWAVLGVVLWR
jgi:hypothetical protein